jgi:hypothetical protein
MILTRANPLLGPLEGVGPEKGKSELFGAKIALTHLFQWLSKWIFPHQNHYVPRHINNRYINKYFSISS